tara:strand:- start:561 stop:854 length:294 start_codon:yes stop_codon:yes gene_type:complete
MKLQRLLELNSILEERKTPCDMAEPFTYVSKSTEGELNIMDMDIIHFIRAFKILSGKKELTTSMKPQRLLELNTSLNIISGKLCIVSAELKEYLNNG